MRYLARLIILNRSEASQRSHFAEVGRRERPPPASGSQTEQSPLFLARQIDLPLPRWSLRSCHSLAWVFGSSVAAASALAWVWAAASA